MAADDNPPISEIATTLRPGRPPNHSIDDERMIASAYASERVRCAKHIVERQIRDLQKQFEPVHHQLELLGRGPLKKADREWISDLTDAQLARARGIEAHWVDKEDGKRLPDGQGVLYIEGHISYTKATKIEEDKAQVRKGKLPPLVKKDKLKAIDREHKGLRRLSRGSRFRLPRRFPKDPPDTDYRTDEQSIRLRVVKKFNAYAEIFGFAPIRPSTVKRYCDKHPDACEEVSIAGITATDAGELSYFKE